MEAVHWIFSKSQFVSYPESFILTSHRRLFVVPLDLFTGFQEEEKCLLGQSETKLLANFQFNQKISPRGRSGAESKDILAVEVTRRTGRRNRSATALTFRDGAKRVITIGFTYWAIQGSRLRSAEVQSAGPRLLQKHFFKNDPYFSIQPFQLLRVNPLKIRFLLVKPINKCKI